MSAGADDNRAAIVMRLQSDEAGMQPVVMDLSVRTTIVHTAFWQLVGLAWLGAHVMAVARLGSGGGVVTLVLAALLYRRMPLVGLMVLFQVMEYQNWVISLMSADMSAGSFRFLQGTSFFVALVCALQALFRLLRDPVERSATRRIAVFACMTLGVVLAYAVLGATVSSLGNAAVGVRNATDVLMAVLIGVDVGRVWGYRTVAIGFLLSLALGGGLAIAEIAAPVDYYRAIDAVSFTNLKNGGANAYADICHSAEELAEWHYSTLFNTTVMPAAQTATNMLSFRFGGPNMHPISYAYLLAVAGVVAVTLRQYWILPILGGLIVMAGVKGALIMLLVALVLQTIWATTRYRGLLIAVTATFAASYLWLGISLGLEAGDYHVIGFLGGVRGFLANPLGHGLGVGGNLTMPALTPDDWLRLEREHSINFGMESAVGELIYQMGIGGLAVLLFFLSTLRSVPFGALHSARSGQNTDILPLASVVAILNGVFQEEAYSPYALALLMLFCGVLIGNDRLALRHERENHPGNLQMVPA